MPRKPTGNPNGRPYKEINQKTFENLCAIQCTKSECCAVLEVDDMTLESWCKRTYGVGFSEIFEEKREFGRVSLRRAQFRLAEKNTAMAIFLGKNWLGQSDHVTVTDTTAIERLDAILKATKENAFSNVPVTESEAENGVQSEAE